MPAANPAAGPRHLGWYVRERPRSEPGGDLAPSLTPAQQAEILEHQLGLSECIRKHGVPDFPDPNGQGPLDLSGVHQGSPRFQAAMKTCEPIGGFRVGRVAVP